MWPFGRRGCTATKEGAKGWRLESWISKVCRSDHRSVERPRNLGNRTSTGISQKKWVLLNTYVFFGGILTPEAMGIYFSWSTSGIPPSSGHLFRADGCNMRIKMACWTLQVHVKFDTDYTDSTYGYWLYLLVEYMIITYWLYFGILLDFVHFSDIHRGQQSECFCYPIIEIWIVNNIFQMYIYPPVIKHSNGKSTIYRCFFPFLIYQGFPFLPRLRTPEGIHIFWLVSREDHSRISQTDKSF